MMMLERQQQSDDKIEIAPDDLRQAAEQIVRQNHQNATVVELEHLSSGRVNDLYKIRIANPMRDLVLRLRTIKDYHYEEGVIKESIVKRLLGETVTIPTIYQEDNSREVLPCEFTLMEFIDGEDLSNCEMSEGNAIKCGQILANIHRVTFDGFGDFGAPEKETNSNWREFFGAKIETVLSALNELDPELSEKARIYFANVIDQVPTDAQPVLNHHDFHGGNIRRSVRDGNLAVLDWDYASIGVPEVDFPKINHLNFRDKPQLSEAFLNGYRSINGEFPEEFFDRLKIYEALWLLRAYVFESTHENPDPDYFPEADYYKEEFSKIAENSRISASIINRARNQILDALEEAGRYIFSTGLNDSGSQLFRSCMSIGLAKLHALQKELGLRDRAIFISTPDENPLRRRVDWLGGFAYGGKLVWGDGDLDMTVLNSKPNGCGMLVGRVSSVDFDRLQGDAATLLNTRPQIVTLDGRKMDVVWDFNLGNHFIDVFDIYDEETGEEMDFKIVIVHSDAPEFKGANQLGMGLYYNKDNPELHRMMKTMNTPFGEVHYVTGNDTRTYDELVALVRDYAEKKRAAAFHYLFDDGEILMNRSHQTGLNRNQIILGAYDIPAGDQTLFPVTISADDDSYLVRGKQSLSDETIDRLDFRKRAQEFGIEDRLRTANIIPHGAGYEFPTLDRVTGFDVREDGQIFPRARFKGESEERSLTSLRELPYKYRGREVIDKSVDIGSLEVAFRLKLLAVLNKDGFAKK